MGIIRKTQSIELLLSEFSNSTGAISAIELIKRLSAKVNKTTVYRVLDKLEDDGVVHSFLDKSGIKWYAKCNSCTHAQHFDSHPHFQCLNCGKVDCLEIEVALPNIPNRQVEVSQILIQGNCESCSK
ncbi:Fur family transcriptional regulator [Algibacter pectinivorans]|uniref:Fur family transcriptional regulator, ferric uptake regulator n=1 Tax=Algibacter pectinivorans TaxID=870482 RepID=A0A1I1P274_9FLAO|nr:transcriptional repressor [Algibacter pectinivorans]SFD03776.1 Fur family transcriptional regulator, ferric uptake regulator [Algibacter pectinivorans]